MRGRRRRRRDSAVALALAAVVVTVALIGFASALSKRSIVSIEPSLMGLTTGERVTVRDLIYGLFLDSGNDAAEALARGIVPRDRFIRQMNQKAKSIGLTNTQFVNPSGLDAPGHGMSAHDIA